MGGRCLTCKEKTDTGINGKCLDCETQGIMTEFKNRTNPSKNDCEISWLKGYTQALQDDIKKLKKRGKIKWDNKKKS